MHPAVRGVVEILERADEWREILVSSEAVAETFNFTWNGWTLARVCNSPPQKPTHYRCSQVANNGVHPCMVGQQFGSGLPTYSAGQTGTCTWNNFTLWRQTGGQPSYATTHVFWRNTFSGAPPWPVLNVTPASVTFTPIPEAFPEPLPMLDPLVQVPIGTPLPAVAAVPYALLPMRGINPHRAPSEQSEGGYSLSPPSPPSPPAPPLHRHDPPGPEVHERKFKAYGMGGVLRKAVEAAFEGVELLESIHAALPDELQAPFGSTAAEKFEAIYENYREVDGCQALENIVNDWFEDAMYGRLGRAAQLEARKVGRSITLMGITKKVGSEGLPIPRINFC